MRIVIKIDGEMPGGGTLLPSSITFTYTPPQPPGTPETPDTPPVATQQPDVDEAGPAPQLDLRLGEPVTFTSTRTPAGGEAASAPIPAAPGWENAGPAKIAGLDEAAPHASMPLAQPVAAGTRAGATNAGPAPTGVTPAPGTAASGDGEDVAPTAENAGPVPELRVSGASMSGRVAGTLGSLVSYAGPAAQVHEADDLTVINGIGPKISHLLMEAGIVTFVQLATCDPEALQQLLAGAGISADAESWPEQARVAATGDVTALEDLQARLK